MTVFRTRSATASAALLTVTAVLAPAPARAEPAACLSPDPAQWPAVSKPYFMLLVDTSGSMISPVAGPAPSCSGYAPTRMGHAKCAVKNTTLAFGGEVDFGLAQYAGFMTGCSANCYGNTGGAPSPACAIQCFNAEVTTTGLCGACGPMDDVNDPSTRRGASVLVGMQIDNVWNSPPGAPMPSNLAALLAYVDNTCTGNTELSNPPVDGYPTGQYGKTPINGALRDMRRYFAAGWTHPDTAAISFPTPLSPLDRSCRSVNVILMTDGDETCDSQTDAVNAAASLFAGVTVGPNTFKIKTHVINFAGGSQSNTDAIAAAGGTIASYFATNEVQLSQALASIVSGAIKPETCDNLDNNCNGCTDEGFTHYCNVQPIAAGCCAWAAPPQRTTCLNGFKASITATNPQGDRALLPCTTNAQVQPATWLCHDPGEKCDGVDNNCVAGVDEGITKCGSPLHCPQPEACNGQDDDCNGLIDEGGVCPNACSPSAETCDGCDNDCDGVADDGIAPIPCGLPPSPTVPGWCAGTITCKAPQSVAVGACAPGGGFNACNNTPHVEVCDGKDDDCNGLLDDGIPSIPCVPAGAPTGLIYGPTSTCKLGMTTCTGGATVCLGWVGPSSEICDGLDNDCDGTADDGVTGAGLPCGVSQPPCTPGLTACVNGTLVCQGGNQPAAEVCNGLDDDCDGVIDEAPLADAPGPGLGGCWTLPGTCCTFQYLAWCPPAGGTCTDNGALTPPCNRGSLACAGAAGWICQDAKGPVAETCDGIDNDCNGLLDDGPLPGVGAPCGSDVGECQRGALACVAGVLHCAGEVPPSPEICDGKDNDCDGAIDDGIPAGAACTVAYDPTLYPGPRHAPPCQPGMLLCDGMGGHVCSGGVGPSPEVCDGVDNDCDGLVDEIGAAPDGLDGTANPLPPTAAHLGGACGTAAGDCKAGSFQCINGLFACVGGQSAAPETCDCEDNDCDGVVDNPGGPGGPPLCSPGKDCVKSSGGCQCAAPCATGEFPCPPGQTCATVTSSQTGQSLPDAHCVTDLDAGCGDCATKTTKDASGHVLCAPVGTVLDGCITPPVCTCKGQSGCVEPCSGVTCPAGQVCANLGPSLGACAVDTCDNNPCQGCGKVCHLGACVDSTTGETTTSATSTTSATGSGGSDLAIWGLATGGGGCSCEVGVGLASRLSRGRLALLALGLFLARRRAKRASPAPEARS